MSMASRIVQIIQRCATPLRVRNRLLDGGVLAPCFRTLFTASRSATTYQFVFSSRLSLLNDGMLVSCGRRFASKHILSDDVVKDRVLAVCKGFDKITADKLQLESNFMTDMGLDSLDHVELIMAVEDEFGFEISDSDAEKLVRPSDIVKYIVHRQEVDKKA